MVEDLIYRAINRVPLVRETMAKYKGNPAVFYQVAPNDEDPGWDGSAMYPRMDYGIDWQANPERKTAGTLVINLWCTNESKTPPEEIAGVVQTELSELFLTDESGTFCIVWSRSDYFESASEKEPKTDGYTLLFDVLAFPKQETTVPDPVFALHAAIKQAAPYVRLIAKDPVGELWKPTNDAPAVYVRTLDNLLSRSSYACSWFKATLGVHVIAPDPNARQKVLQLLSHELGLKGEAITNDGSPFFIQEMKYSTGADVLHSGQMTVSGEYGVLPAEPESSKLWNAYFDT